MQHTGWFTYHLCVSWVLCLSSQGDFQDAGPFSMRHLRYWSAQAKYSKNSIFTLNFCLTVLCLHTFVHKAPSALQRGALQSLLVPLLDDSCAFFQTQFKSHTAEPSFLPTLSPGHISSLWPLHFVSCPLSVFTFKNKSCPVWFSILDLCSHKTGNKFYLP